MAYLKDISAILGLSVSTVSKALKGYPDVSEQTRQKVLRIAEEIEYGSVRKGQNESKEDRKAPGAICVVIAPDIRNFNDYSCCREILGVMAAETLKYDRDFVAITAGKLEKGANWADKAVLYNPAGICLLTGNKRLYGEDFEGLRKCRIPLVSVELEIAGGQDEYECRIRLVSMEPETAGSQGEVRRASGDLDETGRTAVRKLICLAEQLGITAGTD